MAKNWIEVRIESFADSGELLSQLDDPAVTGAWQENGVIRLFWPADRWNPDVLQDIRQVLKELGDASEGPAITVDSLPDEDWNAHWARTVRLIRVGRRVVIRPSWDGAGVRPGDIELIIDPKQAFGTGHHATTRMLIEWLEEVIRPGQRVLDVGTGSGILAMVALRLGAGSALGIDSDPDAIRCAREYAATNKFGPELELRIAALKELKDIGAARFDVVVANLDRRTLLESTGLFQNLLERGGRLLLSGVLPEHQAAIADAFAAEGGMIPAARQCEGWLALEVNFPAHPHVHQISISDGGVPKHPVPEARITVDGVAGDRQRSRDIHGGPDRAVCLFSLEVIEALRAEGHPIAPGFTGENLTLAGLDWARLKPGVRLGIGETVRLEMVSYTAPCRNNAPWFKDGNYGRMSQKRHPGWSRLYARVLTEGTVRRGDAVVMEDP